MGPMATQTRLIWRLRSEHGQIAECELLDHSPLSSEIRIVYVPQGVTVTSSRFETDESAMKTAIDMKDALGGDGWIDFNTFPFTA